MCGHWGRRLRAVGPALDVKKPHVPETMYFAVSTMIFATITADVCKVFHHVVQSYGAV